MITREQSERSEEAVRTVLKSQFPVLTSQVLDNLYQLSKIGEKWSTKLLLLMGAILLLASLGLKLVVIIGYPVLNLLLISPMEFSIMIVASAGLLFFGALLSLLQAWSWRSIIRAQQAVGIEILNKQIDIEKDLLTGKNRHQAGGELILLPTKIRKRHRR